MSFAYDVKKDLCDGKKSHKRCCQLAELYGAMLFSHCFEESKIHLVSENRLVPDHFVSRLQEVLRVEAKVEQKNQQGAYHVYVEDPAKLHKIWEKLGIQRVDDTGELAIDRSLLQKTCCVAAFLRGVFLGVRHHLQPGEGLPFGVFLSPPAFERLFVCPAVGDGAKPQACKTEK